MGRRLVLPHRRHGRPRIGCPTRRHSGQSGVTGAELAFVTRAGRHVVYAGSCQVVAGVTADGVAFGQAGFVPKLLAEFDLLFGKRTDFLHFGRIRQRFEHGLRAFQQGFVFGRNIGGILRGRNGGGACGSIGSARGRSRLRGFGCLSRFLAAGGQRGRNGKAKAIWWSFKRGIGGFLCYAFVM